MENIMHWIKMKKEKLLKKKTIDKSWTKDNLRAFKIDGRALRVNIKTFIFPLNAKQCRKDHL